MRLSDAGHGRLLVVQAWVKKRACRAMKQQVVDRARGVVEAVLGKPCGGAALDVMAVGPEVDGHGDEFLWIYLKYDDDPRGLPNPRRCLG